MAKTSLIQKNDRRKLLAEKYKARRHNLKVVIQSKNVSDEERFDAVLKLAQLPRNSARVRIRNRCELTGRPRGYYRKYKLARVALRLMSSSGMIPGVVKSSW
jgi:small subunit ribosomal protein S14